MYVKKNGAKELNDYAQKEDMMAVKFPVRWYHMFDDASFILEKKEKNTIPRNDDCMCE
jgi:hypothetical protein